MPEEHTVAALILINRLCNYAQKQFERIYVRTGRLINSSTSLSRIPVQITSLTVHRLILVSILIVHKFYTDPFYKNSDISRIGGVHQHEINFLEEEFLDIIDFNLIVDKEDYESYTQSLNAFFSQPLSPETIAIIDKMHNWPQ